MAKIIEFPRERMKYLFIHITLPMLKALITACNRENNNLTFTKKDLEGAFVSLYKNGLIDVKHVEVNGKKKNVWYVTNLGKKALDTSGIKNVG